MYPISRYYLSDCWRVIRQFVSDFSYARGTRGCLLKIFQTIQISYGWNTGTCSNNKSVSRIESKLATRLLSVVTDQFSRRVAPFRARVTIPIIIIRKYSRRCYSRKEKKKKPPSPRRLKPRRKDRDVGERRSRTPLALCLAPLQNSTLLPPPPMEDRGISITTCMYVGESSKSWREILSPLRIANFDWPWYIYIYIYLPQTRERIPLL